MLAYQFMYGYTAGCTSCRKKHKSKMEIILKYFKDLTDEQKRQFAELDALYHDWNSKINVISRKDIDNLYEHHVLHSLAIAKALRFRPGTRVLDFGCGGGFPGIPLAIMFPETRFRLIDGTGKKERVAQEVADAIGLKKLVTAWCLRRLMRCSLMNRRSCSMVRASASGCARMRPGSML